MNSMDADVRGEDLSYLLDVQLNTKLKVKDLDTQDDVITFSLVTMTMAVSNLISLFSLNNLAKQELDIALVGTLLKKTITGLFHLCNAINYELPNISDNPEFEMGIAYEVVASPVLTCFDINRAVSDISYFIHVVHPGAMWADEEEEDEEFHEYMLTILVGLKNLCKRYGIPLKDIAV